MAEEKGEPVVLDEGPSKNKGTWEEKPLLNALGFWEEEPLRFFLSFSMMANWSILECFQKEETDWIIFQNYFQRSHSIGLEMSLNSNSES